MKNMFSDRAEKQVPRDLRSCYETDAITRNLWVWCERLEKWGSVIFWLILLYGIFDTIQTAIDVADQHSYLEDLNNIELRFFIQAQAGKLPSVPETVIICIFKWLLYAFLEYCGYHVVALLVGSLASIVQHNKIAADVALYTCASAEGCLPSEAEEYTAEETTPSSAAPASQSAPKAAHKRKAAPVLKEDEWYCPDCDRIHKSYVGTCGCGMMRPAAAAPKAPTPTPSKPSPQPEPEVMPQLAADEWYCPDCHLVHKNYVGTCGCGRKRS